MIHFRSRLTTDAGSVSGSSRADSSTPWFSASPVAAAGRRQYGFSLLEVVVAFAILAISLGLLIQIYSRALNTTVLSGDYSRAATLAEARLNRVGIETPLELGSYTGEPQEELSWQVTIEPYDLGELPWESNLEVFLVNSVVTWGEASDRQRRIGLSTLRFWEEQQAFGVDSEP